mgnify:CR=1 FL=1
MVVRPSEPQHAALVVQAKIVAQGWRVGAESDVMAGGAGHAHGGRVVAVQYAHGVGGEDFERHAAHIADIEPAAAQIRDNRSASTGG